MSRSTFALALALAAFAHRPGPAFAAESVRLAVLPVVVHSLESPDYLQAGLADMLASRLARHPGIEVVRLQHGGGGTSDPQSARSAGRAVGAQFVLFGSFTRFGEGASLDLECAAVEGAPETREVFVQAGELGDVIPKLDEVAEKVASFALRGAAGVRSGEVAGGVAGAAAAIDELRRRVEALERALAASGAAGGPALSEPSAPEPSGGAGASRSADPLR